jgi:hypothetical protein
MKMLLESLTFTAGAFSAEEWTWKHKCGHKIPVHPILDAATASLTLTHYFECPGCGDLLQVCVDGRKWNIYGLPLEPHWMRWKLEIIGERLLSEKSDMAWSLLVGYDPVGISTCYSVEQASRA